MSQTSEKADTHLLQSFFRFQWVFMLTTSSNQKFFGSILFFFQPYVIVSEGQQGEQGPKKGRSS